MFLLDNRALLFWNRTNIQNNDRASLSEKTNMLARQIADSIQTQTEAVKLGRTGVNLLDLTTAWVCADVPEAMLVRAQAASNWRLGLYDKETKTKWRQNIIAQPVKSY